MPPRSLALSTTAFLVFRSSSVKLSSSNPYFHAPHFPSRVLKDTPPFSHHQSVVCSTFTNGETSIADFFSRNAFQTTRKPLLTATSSYRAFRLFFNHPQANPELLKVFQYRRVAPTFPRVPYLMQLLLITSLRSYRGRALSFPFHEYCHERRTLRPK